MQRKQEMMSGEHEKFTPRKSRPAGAQAVPPSNRDKAQAQAALRQVAAWIEEQAGHVWRALAGEGSLEPARRDLRVARSGRTSMLGFWYQGTCLAQGKSYFSQEENQWKFELTWVAPEYYPRVKAYFTRRIDK